MMDITRLAPPMPRQWMGLFDSLDKSQPLRKAECWIEENMSNYGSHTPQQWHILLQYLSDSVIVSKCRQINIEPVLSSLPLTKQQMLLAIIYQHRGDMQKDTLKEFVGKAGLQDTKHSWVNALWKLLAKFAGVTFQDKTILTDKLTTETIVIPTRKNDDMDIDKPQNRDIDKLPQNESGEVILEDKGKTDQDSDNQRGDNFVIVLDEDEEASMSLPKKVKIEDPASPLATVKPCTSDDLQLEAHLVEKGTELYELVHSSVEDGATLREGIQPLLHIAPHEIQAVCRSCGLEDLPDSQLETVCQVLTNMTDQLTFTYSVALICGLITRKLSSLDHSASRVLQGCVLSLAEVYPLQLLDAILVPSFLNNLGSPQSELLCHLCENALSNFHQAQMLRKLCDEDAALSDSALPVIQRILESKPELDSSLHSQTVNLLYRLSYQQRTSLMFAKLLLNYVNKYGKEWTPSQLSTMRQVCGNHRTFLANKLNSALKKLSK